MKKIILNIVGMLNIVLAVIGAILPVMPTVPFLLVAAMCFTKSNVKIYNWMYNNKVFGVILRNFKEKCGLPRWMKIYSVAAMWVGLFVVIIALPIWWLQIILAVFGICISIRLVSIKTYDPNEHRGDESEAKASEVGATDDAPSDSSESGREKKD